MGAVPPLAQGVWARLPLAGSDQQRAVVLEIRTRYVKSWLLPTLYIVRLGLKVQPFFRE
jgi:hypothetical protein